jgi:hypothetical protein
MRVGGIEHLMGSKLVKRLAAGGLAGLAHDEVRRRLNRRAKNDHERAARSFWRKRGRKANPACATQQARDYALYLVQGGDMSRPAAERAAAAAFLISERNVRRYVHEKLQGLQVTLPYRGAAWAGVPPRRERFKVTITDHPSTDEKD